MAGKRYHYRHHHQHLLLLHHLRRQTGICHQAAQEAERERVWSDEGHFCHGLPDHDRSRYVFFPFPTYQQVHS